VVDDPLEQKELFKLRVPRDDVKRLSNHPLPGSVRVELALKL
jgi:hypothetical protein